MTEINNTKDLAKAYKTPFAWPGGYAIQLILSDGEVLCRDCFKSEYKNVCESVMDQDNSGWRAVGTEILWEGEHYCGHCSTRIESEYGGE